jgi:hypothetical protein
LEAEEAAPRALLAIEEAGISAGESPMSEEGLLRTIEQHLQLQQAEVTVNRIILSTLITRVLAANPDHAEERLRDLKGAALTMLGKMIFEATTPEQTEHAKTQVREQIEARFRDLEVALSATQTSPSGERH